MVAINLILLVDKAVKQAKHLRQTIMKIGETQNEIEDLEAEEEAEKEDSDYPADELQDYMSEEEGLENRAEIIDVLEMADALLYKLIEFNHNNGSSWENADDYDEKTMLKLKEINDSHKETLLQHHIRE